MKKLTMMIRSEDQVELTKLDRTRPSDEKDGCVPAPPTKRRKTARKVCIVEEANEEFPSSYCKEDISNAWLSQSDYSNIKQSNRETLMAIVNSLGDVGRLDANVCCLRGLETVFEMIYTNSKRQVSKYSIDRVLSDQESMRARGLYSAEALAGGYREASRPACRRGLELASIDALG
jgi:hypothetical protein